MLVPYTSVREAYRKETEIRKSVFIAELFPVGTEEEALSCLAQVRKTYKDATHHCWAWRIGTTQVREKSSDDGEPQGTAGHPMLHVLQMREMTNVLAVVTRYFGGIKLGAGGLTRAYSGTLAEAAEEATVVCYTPYLRMELVIPYAAVGAFEHYIEGTDIRVLDRTFTDTVAATFLCLPENKERHGTFFRDMTGGRAVFTETGEEYVGLEQKA